MSSFHKNSSGAQNGETQWREVCVGATKSRVEWRLLQTMSALFRPGRDSAGADQTANFNSRFLGLSARCVCCSLLTMSSPCQSSKRLCSCEMVFHRPGLCADGSATNWLRSQNVDFVTQPAFQKWAKDLLNIEWKHKEIRAVMVRRICHQLCLIESTLIL